MTTVQKTGILQLRLTQFRSYETVTMRLNSSFEPVILTGHNGAGKTNILEAVSFLTPGRGLRSARLSDVARRADGEEAVTGIDILPARWSVSATVQTPDDIVTVGTGTVDGSERRQVRIDGKPVAKQSDLGQVLRCLWLTPAQDRLFCGDPVSRRRFLDRLVQAFDGQHANRISDYNAAFKQWSCLLREGRTDASWLEALEQQMVETGVAVAASRLDVVSRVSQYLRVSEDPLFPTAEICLTGVVEQALLTQAAVDVEDQFFDRLRRSRKIYAEGGSLAGPHTADFKVIHKQKNRDASLCSTGEQKALLLSIILAEMRAQMQEQGMCPLLLLDEVAAHLDSRRRNTLFDILCDRPTQVWMTGTEEESFGYLTNRASFFTIQESEISLQKAA